MQNKLLSIDAELDQLDPYPFASFIYVLQCRQPLFILCPPQGTITVIIIIIIIIKTILFIQGIHQALKKVSMGSLLLKSVS